MVRRLEDLDVLVVAARRDRRAGVEADQAALAQPPVLVAVGADAGRAHAHRTRARQILLERQDVHLDARLQRRQPAVGRVDDSDVR